MADQAGDDPLVDARNGEVGDPHAKHEQRERERSPRRSSLRRASTHNRCCSSPVTLAYGQATENRQGHGRRSSGATPLRAVIGAQKAGTPLRSRRPCERPCITRRSRPSCSPRRPSRVLQQVQGLARRPSLREHPSRPFGGAGCGRRKRRRGSSEGIAKKACNSFWTAVTSSSALHHGLGSPRFLASPARVVAGPHCADGIS